MNDTPESPPLGSQKVDPETLVLRGGPRRVVRFRRGAIIAIAAAGSTALVGVAWMALKPVTFRAVIAGDDHVEAGSKAPLDALANAPKTYGDVPQLGAPLPGDLGRPILAHQNEIATPQKPAIDPAAQAAEAERQRQEAERKSAMESGVMMQIGAATRQDAPPATAPSPAAAKADASPRVALEPERDPNGQQRKADFMATKDNEGDTNPHALNEPLIC